MHQGSRRFWEEVNWTFGDCPVLFPTGLTGCKEDPSAASPASEAVSWKQPLGGSSFVPCRGSQPLRCVSLPWQSALGEGAAPLALMWLIFGSRGPLEKWPLIEEMDVTGALVGLHPVV